MTYSTTYGERITKADYLALREHFLSVSEPRPCRRWGLTEEVEGTCYYIETADTAVCIKHIDIHHCEVLGAFKMTHAPAYELGALAINKLIRSLGYPKASLTCFEPVSSAWKRQGWVQSALTPFDVRLAPSAWKEEYGRPDVLTMWRWF